MPTAKRNCTFLTSAPLVQMDRHAAIAVEYTHPDSTPYLRHSSSKRPAPPADHPPNPLGGSDNVGRIGPPIGQFPFLNGINCRLRPPLETHGISLPTGDFATQ